MSRPRSFLLLCLYGLLCCIKWLCSKARKRIERVRHLLKRVRRSLAAGPLCAVKTPSLQFKRDSIDSDAWNSTVQKHRRSVRVALSWENAHSSRRLNAHPILPRLRWPVGGPVSLVSHLKPLTHQRLEVCVSPRF